MATNEVQVIETSGMQPLTEFPVNPAIENRARMRIGIVGDDVVIASCGVAGGWGGSMLFERRNAAAVRDLLADLLNGKLAEEGLDHLSFNQGKDRIGAGWQMPRDVFSYSFHNNRLVKMDGFQTRSWNIYADPDTMLGIYVELDELLKKGLL